jgi:5'-nucleotidase
VTSVPATAAPTPPVREKPTTPTTHVVAAGDTLWDLAKTYYGDAKQWHKLVAANRNIKPHRLLVGEKLTIPAK